MRPEPKIDLLAKEKYKADKGSLPKNVAQTILARCTQPRWEGLNRAGLRLREQVGQARYTGPDPPSAR